MICLERDPFSGSLTIFSGFFTHMYCGLLLSLRLQMIQCNLLRHLLKSKCFSSNRKHCSNKTSVQAHWRKNAWKLLTNFFTNFHLANEIVCFLQCSGK